jgi:hypothetical protein
MLNMSITIRGSKSQVFSGGKRGPQCSICASKHRHALEVGLAHGIAHNALARRFGVSPDAIGRHAANHVSPAVKAAILTASAPSAIDLDALQASESEGLLNQLVHQRARLQQCVSMAVDYGDVKAAISAEAAITANLQLVSRLLGMLVNVSEHRSTSILISGDYLALRAALLKALKPFPEAAAAVGDALARLETESAESIRAAAGKPPKREALLIEHETVVPHNEGALLPPPPPPDEPPC